MQLIGLTVDCLGELTVYVDEDRRGVYVSVGNLALSRTAGARARSWAEVCMTSPHFQHHAVPQRQGQNSCSKSKHV